MVDLDTHLYLKLGFIVIKGLTLFSSNIKINLRSRIILCHKKTLIKTH